MLLFIVRVKANPIPSIKQIILILLAGLLYTGASGQTRAISGTVLDSLSHNPLSNISVRHGSKGTLSNSEGHFTIRIDIHNPRLTLSALGYQTITVSIPDTSTQLVIYLSKTYSTLKEFVISHKKKYRNKNNPAVELIRKVIENKPINGPGADDYSSWKQYEKTRLLLDKLPKIIVDNKLLRRYHFMFENKDSTTVPGKNLVPVYISEMVSQHYFRRHPKKDKTIITGHKSVDFGEFIDMKGISAALSRLYEDINIYDNTIEAFTMQFVSPAADLAPTFYMYYIRDTVTIDNQRLVQLYFTPRNPEDLLFRGTLYITLDGRYAIRRAELGVAKHINLNYVRGFNVRQDFKRTGNGRYQLSTSDMIALFSAFPHSPGVVGERIVIIDSIDNTPVADTLLAGPAVDSLPQVGKQADSFWTDGRPTPLSANETRTYANTDSLVKMKSYHRLMDYTTAFTAGYKSVGKFDVGAIGTFYTFDPIEGQRLKFGGRTSTRLNTHWYGDGYVAYGTKDDRWKYSISGAYAFNNKSIWTYPAHYLQASYQNDVKSLGAENAFSQGNNFFTSFSHGDNSKWLYNHIFRASYVHEFSSHFSYTLGIKYWRQAPTGTLNYLYQPMGDMIDTAKSLTTGEINTTLRWAPNEQFFQNKAGRVNIVNRWPILTLQYARGIKGFMQGQYNYDALHLNVYKRWYVAPFGYSDITFDAGYIGGRLPFPLLVVHPANTSYFYTQNSYNMMNVGEFVSDHYAGLNIDHFFNGFFFNKIPGVKRLRLREVIGGKILYGGMRDSNNPNLDPTQMKFPLTKGLTSTYILGAQPYVEGSVGIYNIFSIFRLDLVKRFTYLDHPNISKVGLRISSNFNF